MGKYTMTTRGRTFKWHPDTSVGGFKGNMSHPLDDFWYSLVPEFPWDWDDYGSVQKYSTYPVVGGIFSRRLTQLEYDENERRQRDKAKNLGYSLEDVRYPIHSGLYGRYGGDGSYVEATSSVIGLYSDLMRWTKW